MIGCPPGNTYCDWCHEAVAWKDTQFTHDNEAICPECWPEWTRLIAETAYDRPMAEHETDHADTGAM